MHTGSWSQQSTDGRLLNYGPPPPTPSIAPIPTAPGPRDGRTRWPPLRVSAVSALWGAGFTGPGGAAETLRLAAPIGLNRNASLLLVGGGMGGSAETIVDSYGSWVASFEADERLADIAEVRRTQSPAAQRIQIAGWDRNNPSFGRHNAHHAMALEACRGASPAAMLDAVADALCPQGHIVMTELVADTAAPQQDREFAAWCRLESRLPALPRLDDVTDALARLHFDVRVVEDVSDRHVSEILAGWRAAVKGMARGPKPDMAIAAAFVNEAELWLLRIRLMRRFGFRLVRWHAVGSA
jgi:cyclopropane fatty-acyl-phospholipid synthase-like methyltransferase